MYIVVYLDAKYGQIDRAFVLIVYARKPLNIKKIHEM